MRLRTLSFLALLSFPFAAVADVPLTGVTARFEVDRQHVDESAGTIPIRVTVANDSGAAISAVQALFATPNLIRATDNNGWSCHNTSYSTVCDFTGTLKTGASALFDAAVLFGRQPLRQNVDFNIIWTDPAGQRQATYDRESIALYKRFVVTSTADSGAGSLRDAIASLNADPVCANAPCGIDFQLLSTRPAGWETIQLRSPLPPLTASDVTIDGESQTRFGGDSNPNGPEIELRGEGVAGDGLEFRSGYSEARGLAIGGFGGNGILLTIAPKANGAFRFERNYLGTDATGANAAPNGLRGLMITGGYVHGDIRDNVLSGNVRSGLWVWPEQSPGFLLVPSMRVTGNRVGVQAHSEAQLPNGASGLFFSPTTDGAIVENNLIAYNRDAGVAVGRGARIIRVRGNSIAHNGAAGIDVGLDGPSSEGSNEPYGIPSAPVITSATFDEATGVTTLTAMTPATSFYFLRQQVDFYASDTREHGEFAEGQRYLGTATAGEGGTRFTFTIHEDLRGKFITGVTFRIIDVDGSLLYQTGELSKALQVR